MNAFIREDIAKVFRKHGTIFHVLTQRKGLYFKMKILIILPNINLYSTINKLSRFLLILQILHLRSFKRFTITNKLIKIKLSK